MKFSVIIPVYNMEKYVRRCLDSVLGQKIDDFEVIAIDDGSTDNSHRILDEYSAIFPQVHVIHQENSGIGAAYRNGLKNASGEYICFVDSDDYIDSSLLQDLNEVVEQYRHPSVIQFGLLFEDESSKVIRCDYPKASVLYGNREILKGHFEQFPTPSLACRAFKKELFDDVIYLDQNIGIDEILIVQLLLKASVIINLEKCYYHVFLREASVSRNDLTRARLKQFINVYDILKDVTKNSSLYAYNNILIKWLKLIQELFFERGMNDQDKAFFLKEFKETYSTVKGTEEYHSQNTIYKIGVCVFALCPDLYRILRKNK